MTGKKLRALQSITVGTAGVIASLMMPFVQAQPSDQNTSADVKQSRAKSAHAPHQQQATQQQQSTVLAQQPTELKPIQVTSELEEPGSRYRVYQTDTGTRTNTRPINIPQSIQAIPRKVIRDQAAQSLEDVVRNAPGVYVQQGEGNRDEFYIRGVKTKSDFFMDGLRDDTEYFRPMYNVAHVDVLQGPAAVLFGRGGAGGIINLVTKKPVRRSIRRLSVMGGSWRRFRGTFDVGDALTPYGAFRLMGMGESSGGFRDHFYLHRYAINPKFHFQIGDRTQVDFGASYLNDRRFADRGIPSEGGRPAGVSRSKFFGSPSQNIARTRVQAFRLFIRHKINDYLQVHNAFRVVDNDKFYRNAFAGSAVNNQGQLNLAAYQHPNNRLSYIDRLETIATFDTGVLRHKLLTGAMFSWQRGNDIEATAEADEVLAGTVPVSNPTVSNLSFSFLQRNNHVVGKEVGVYAEDQISLGRHWKALFGVRWDRFIVDADYRKPGVTPDHTRNVTNNWSPRLGLIYKPVENDSIYVSWTRTFTPQGANIALQQTSPTGANLGPQMATNYEIGNKLDLFDGDLSITAALFQLDLNNVVAPAADGSPTLVSTGAQRNRGFQLSVAGALTPKWRVYANYSYINAKITKTTEDAKAGAAVGLVPHNQFSVWTVYALTPHWGIGGGVQGASRKYTSFTNEVVLPSYVVGSAMAYYQVQRYRLQINVNNLSNEQYYPTASGDNQIMPGAPRNVIARLSVDF